jgi:hypothetical protein
MLRRDDPTDQLPPIPQGSGIKIRGWSKTISEVKRLARGSSCFWDVWRVVQRRYLKRYSGIGCPTSGPVFRVLWGVYQAAGGAGGPLVPRSFGTGSPPGRHDPDHDHDQDLERNVEARTLDRKG